MRAIGSLGLPLARVGVDVYAEVEGFNPVLDHLNLLFEVGDDGLLLDLIDANGVHDGLAVVIASVMQRVDIAHFVHQALELSQTINVLQDRQVGLLYLDLELNDLLRLLLDALKDFAAADEGRTTLRGDVGTAQLGVRFCQYPAMRFLR